MSTIVFQGLQVQDKRLVKTLKYKAYLSADEKEKIVKELRISVPDLDEAIVSMHVDIEIKYYDIKNT